MKNTFFTLFLITTIFFTGCRVARPSFSPGKKYSPRQLEKDYTIFENLLKESHPSLYWYTSKDSMEFYFNWGRGQIKDSLTEPQFKNVLSYVLAKINCGHTTARFSKKYSKYLDTIKNEKFFPLSLKLWPDTAVVVTNLNRKDTILKRGTVIKSINHQAIQQLNDTFFKYISSDGYNLTHKYQTLSNRGGFGNLYTSLFGLYNNYTVDFIDSSGRPGSIVIPVYDAAKDTFNRAAIRRFIRPTKKERKKINLETGRALRIDTMAKTAFMDVNSFGKGFHLRQFFHQSFKILRKKHISYLVIDVRSNGGGNVSNSTLLTRYLAEKKFKMADSLYAICRHSHYSSYIQNNFLNRAFMFFFTRRKNDGYYHFSYYEKHFFKPKEKNHFTGKTYIMIGGNSFSATTLFVREVINQPDVTVVGEETGGGAYGNSAWLLPDVKLPETKLLFRLPLFRLVIDKNYPKNGHGIFPEAEAVPTVEAIKKNEDYKLNKVLQLINADKQHKLISQ